ncbi:MAG: hypothetical protein ACI89L_002827 [Phycisphaerales bacterium]
MAVKIKRTLGGKIGHGSNEDIEAVQKLLNRHASTVGYKKVKEDGDCGKGTINAIKEFQKRCVTEVKPDGRVEPGRATLLALNMSAGDLKAWLKGNESDDPDDAAQSIEITLAKETHKFSSQKELDKFLDTVVIITVNGKRYVFIGKEWDDFHADMIRTLKRTLVAGARQRAEMAMGVWAHFAELNNDQYVVSWFVSLAGPDLPSFNIVNDAAKAAKKLEDAVKGGDFKKIKAAFAAAEAPINKAYDTMWDYQKAVIGRAEGWVTGLKVVKTTSFIIVGAIAAPLMAPTVGLAGAGALASGGTALVSTTAEEMGKYSAGTSDGLKAALKNISLNTVIDATVGAFLKGGYGKKFVEALGKKVVVDQGSKWAGKSAAQKYVTAYLKNAGESALEESIKQAGEMVKGKTKADEFLGKVAKGTGLGGIMKSLDDAVDNKYAGDIYDSMKDSVKKEIFGTLKKPEAVKFIGGIINGVGGDVAGKGLDFALSKATGNEKEAAIVKTAAKKTSADAKFQALLEKKVANRK